MSYAGLLRLANQAAKRDQLKLLYSDEEIDEQERDLLGSGKDLAINTLGAVGHISDIPGSIVRALAIGEPGRAFYGIMNPDQVVTGEEVGRKLGTELGMWGGLGLEVAMDPLTYLTGGLSVIGKGAGKGARVGRSLLKSGVIKNSDDVVAMGARKADDIVSRARYMVEEKARKTITDDFAPGFEAIENAATGVFGDGWRGNKKLLTEAVMDHTDEFSDLERKHAKTWIDQALAQQDLAAKNKTSGGLFGKPLLGPRKLRQMMSAEDAVKHSIDPDMAFKSLLGQMKESGLVDVSRKMEGVDELMKVLGHEGQQLGTHMRWGIGPLSVPINIKTPKLGGLGFDMAGVMDNVGGMARWSKPGRFLARLGAKRGMMGAASWEVQMDAPGLWALQQVEMGRAAKKVQELVSESSELSESVSSDILRETLEAKSPRALGKLLSDGMHKHKTMTHRDTEIIRSIKSKSDLVFKDSLERMRDAGMRVRDLDDSMIRYFPRQAVIKSYSELRHVSDPYNWEKSITDVADPNFSGRADTQIHRGSHLRNVVKGTRTIKKILQDDRLNDLLEKAAKSTGDGRKYGEVMRKFEDTLEKKYGHLLKNTFIGSADDAEWAAFLEQNPWYRRRGKKVNAHAARFASWMKHLSPDERGIGVFGNDLFSDMEFGLKQAEHAAATNEQAMQIISRWARPSKNITGSDYKKAGTISVREALESIGMETEFFEVVEGADEIVRIAERPMTHIEKLAGRMRGRIQPTRARQLHGSALDSDGVNAVLDMALPKHIGDDLVRMKEAYKLPGELTPIFHWLDSWMTVTKAHLTAPFAAFAGRNLMSGQLRNKFMGLWSMRSVNHADKLMDLSVEAVPGVLERYKPVQTELKRRGMAANDKNATTVLREWIYAEDLVPATGLGYDITGGAGVDPFTGLTTLMEEGGKARKTVESVGAMQLKGRPGMQHVAKPGLRTIFDYFKNIHKPFHVAGGTEFSRAEGNILPGFNFGKVYSDTEFGPVKAGTEVNRWIEGENRVSPWLESMRKGWDPEAAARRVKDGQVDYQGRNFTPFEKNFLQRIFPFYKFRAGQFKWLPGHLEAEPGGAIAQTIRASGRLQGDEYKPEWIQSGVSAQLPSSKEGVDQYLTGMGFMFEDPIGMLSTDPGVMGKRILSSTRPEIKVPLEMATGMNFFQGGRPLEDVKSTSQSLIHNLMGTHPSERRAEEMRGRGSMAEHLLMNSPLSRYLTTLNTMTRDVPDIMRGDPSGLAGTAAQLTTGMGVHKVYDSIKDAVRRDLAADKLKETAPDMTKEFSRTYVPVEGLAELVLHGGPEGRAKAQKLVAIQEILNRLAKKGQSKNRERQLKELGSEKAVKEYAKMLRDLKEQLEREQRVPSY